MDRIATSYDRLASAYASRYFDELDAKPFDRLMLDWLVARCPPGPICDLGCGPGQVAAYLHARGASARGIDCSAASIAEARARVPDVAFDVGDLTVLGDVVDGAFSGIAAFYAIVHLAPDALADAFRAWHRVLAPDGFALTTFHVGDGTRHFDELLGVPVDLDFRFFAVDDVVTALHDAGFDVTEVLERGPYEGVEAPTRRAYVWSRRLCNESAPGG